MSQKTLRELFYEHNGNLIHKWDHYFEIYEKYFSKYIGEKINILEIGISHGGSIQLWKKYFGDKVHVYAIDINPQCKKLEEERITIFIGSQSDKQFLNEILQQLPELDIILDDGGHTMIQQKLSFDTLYQKVKEGGVYMIEDTHTSYWDEFQGGLKKFGNFIEYSKNLIDSLYEKHINKGKRKLLINDITQNINCISFYDSMVVFEKLKRKDPFHIRRGTESIIPYIPPEVKEKTVFRKIIEKLSGRKDSFTINDKGKAE